MPKLSGLSLPQIRTLTTVSDCGTITQAAKQLKLAQPSVSNHITAVEQRYKVKLFDRRGSILHPTTALQRLLPKLRSIALLSAEVEHELDTARDLRAGTLRIGYSTYQATVPLLSRFMQCYPDIDLEAVSAVSQDLIHDVERGILDLACITASEIPAQLSGVTLRPVRLVVIAPDSHPLAQRDLITMADLQDLPLVQREKGSATRALFEGRAKLAQMRLNTVLAVGSWGAICDLVRAGTGLGIALDIEAENSPGITGIPLHDAGPRLAQYAIHLPERRAIASVQAFLQLAQT